MGKFYQCHTEHDFKIRKQEKMLPKENIKYADSGVAKIESNVVIPHKRYRADG
ncbi:hypothetical protein Wcon_00465 [Wolbachia endosymbiont of Cylisticus convexus]|nr:hypothetical protein Wxf_03048 [Armadillidium vulgare] [Wolbachia endosymbiont of Armadillidium vulgare]RDD33747.1 hypothetical protein Wcon_02235 [Wolbachia endosymbiont of Cylisticus convexus]RDD33753.1 putative transposase [Wolbachia endosymbiont of Cylisticus convexus]RDD34194.1 hypothetical protein Wcon_01754 [Wolbachia endosymbiont of Cylisticus convexus]RDD35077.1 hypothetical protein Wcon_00818 [Wolbachia endosymbiont of Cylisticus convexus]